MQAGDAPNVIPEKAVLKGTTRSFDPETRERLPELIEAAEQEDVDDYDDFTEDELLQQLSERLN